jgi:methylglutamate dehydrogenase subunit D
MPDRGLQARAPLAGLALPGRSGAAARKPGLLIEERTDLALATVMARHGKEQDLKGTVAAAYGLDLPDGPRVASKDGVSFAGIGGGQWFAAAEPGQTDFVPRLRARLAGLASIADQSDGRVVLRLRGDRVREVLAKGVPLDRTRGASRPAMSHRPWSPMSACRSNNSTTSRPFSSWLSAVSPAVFGPG